MRQPLLVALSAVMLSVTPHAGCAQSAQSGSFGGSVARDSSGSSMIGEAIVQLPTLGRSITTNWLGEFQFSNVPAGRYTFTVRAIGFQPYLDSVDIKPAARLNDAIVLTAAPVNLAAEQTTAEKRLPAGLAEMEDRRKRGLGGYFVTDSMLRANNERKITYFFAHIPGIHEELSLTGAGVFLANGRVNNAGGRVFTDGGQGDGTFPPGKCYMDIFIDGSPYFLGPAGVQNPPPDFGALWAQNYSGIEYYPSGASVPPQYNGTKTSCGTILLWTRRTP